jgi:hypothetical protein
MKSPKHNRLKGLPGVAVQRLVRPHRMLTHKNENELNTLALQICQILNGIPLGQALWLVEKQVPLLLGDGHLVDTTAMRFNAMRTTFQSPGREGAQPTPSPLAYNQRETV